jgi:hypothetical protein
MHHRVAIQQQDKTAIGLVNRLIICMGKTKILSVLDEVHPGEILAYHLEQCYRMTLGPPPGPWPGIDHQPVAENYRAQAPVLFAKIADISKGTRVCSK